MGFRHLSASIKRERERENTEVDPITAATAGFPAWHSVVPERPKCPLHLQRENIVAEVVGKNVPLYPSQAQVASFMTQKNDSLHIFSKDYAYLGSRQPEKPYFFPFQKYCVEHHNTFFFPENQAPSVSGIA